MLRKFLLAMLGVVWMLPVSMAKPIDIDAALEKLKGIKLSPDGAATLDVGGSLRYRIENWDNVGFVQSRDDTTHYGQLLLHGKVKLGEHMGALVEVKSAPSSDRRELGGRRAALDHDTFALQQGYMDFKIPIGKESGLLIRPGRMALALGKQRYISPLGWSNVRRAWDGVLTQLKLGDATITSVYTQVVAARPFDSNKANEDLNVYGVYSNFKVLEGKDLDLYWLVLDSEANTTDSKRHTIGFRFGGKINNFDYDMEEAMQVGDTATGRIKAYMVALVGGYTFADVKTKPRVFVGYDYGSGDGNAADSVNRTHSHLLPLGHAYLGWADYLGRQNIRDYNFGVECKPYKKLKVKAQVHIFRKAVDADTLYNAGGAAIAGTGGLNSKDVGEEYDLLLKYPISKALNISGGYSYFDAGRLISLANPNKDNMTFLYTQIQYKF